MHTVTDYSDATLEKSKHWQYTEIINDMAYHFAKLFQHNNTTQPFDISHLKAQITASGTIL